ncbi:MAG: hypothetical protein ACRYG7_07790 [Janthinobacterium lividum]
MTTIFTSGIGHPGDVVELYGELTDKIFKNYRNVKDLIIQHSTCSYGGGETAQVLLTIHLQFNGEKIHEDEEHTARAPGIFKRGDEEKSPDS